MRARGAELAVALNEAAIRQVQREAVAMSQKDLLAAVDTYRLSKKHRSEESMEESEVKQVDPD